MLTNHCNWALAIEIRISMSTFQYAAYYILHSICYFNFSMNTRHMRHKIH